MTDFQDFKNRRHEDFKKLRDAVIPQLKAYSAYKRKVNEYKIKMAASLFGIDLDSHKDDYKISNNKWQKEDKAPKKKKKKKNEE